MVSFKYHQSCLLNLIKLHLLECSFDERMTIKCSIKALIKFSSYLDTALFLFEIQNLDFAIRTIHTGTQYQMDMKAKQDRNEENENEDL